MVIKLNDPVLINKENNILQSKEEAFGRQIQYYIMHPYYLVFVDEVGGNTSKRNDGKAGNLLTMTVLHHSWIYPCNW
jgi:hypothetical protein